MKSLNLQNDAILSLTRLFTQPLELPSLLERVLEVDAETSVLAWIGIRSVDPRINGVQVYSG